MNCKTLRGAIMYYPPYPPRSQQDLRNYHQFVPSYEEYEEKNQIRRQANKIGLTMVGNRFFYFQQLFPVAHRTYERGLLQRNL